MLELLMKEPAKPYSPVDSDPFNLGFHPTAHPYGVFPKTTEMRVQKTKCTCLNPGMAS